MKLLRFLYACTFLCISTLVGATAPEESRPFDLIEISLEILHSDIIQETSTPTIFDFFQHHANQIKKLQNDLEKARSTAIKNIENEKVDAEKQLQKRISQALYQLHKQQDQTHQKYLELHTEHSIHLQELTIDEQSLAIENFKATAVAERDTRIEDLKKEEDIILQQLHEQHTYNLNLIALKKEVIAHQYQAANERFQKIIEDFDKEEEKALITAQMNYLENLEQHEFDEYYTTATQPSMWSGMGSIFDGTTYTYRANQGALQCSGCFTKDDSHVASNLKQQMEAAQSHQAFQYIAMMARSLKKTPKEPCQNFRVGIQTCRIEGDELRCKTIQDAYNRLIQERLIQQNLQKVDDL